MNIRTTCGAVAIVFAVVMTLMLVAPAPAVAQSGSCDIEIDVNPDGTLDNVTYHCEGDEGGGTGGPSLADSVQEANEQAQYNIDNAQCMYEDPLCGLAMEFAQLLVDLTNWIFQV